ncbi:MAG: tetratricopeptide repeat protein [Caldilineaceae bacterium]|nr:tetratricopeptide repeat protein [Caldilineaceae bacterium]
MLGSIRISDEQGNPFYLGMRKEEALLAYLAVEHSHTHSRDSLVGLLWPDSPTDKARLSLRVTLSRLKKRLENFDVDALFRATSHDIQFMLDGCQVDVVEFHKLLRSGDQHDHHREELCDRCQPAFVRAVSLYRGAFLEGLFIDESHLFDEWLFMQRERFRIQMLDALGKLTLFHLRRHDYKPALTYARAQLEIDALCEQAHYQIMQIHVAQGDQTSALRQFARCRAVLRDELGVEPSMEIRELHQQILTTPINAVDLPVYRATVDTHPSQSPLPVYLTPFVGRQDEISLLSERISSGDYRLITLSGAGGMGKTRLAVEAARLQSEHFGDGVYFVPFASVENTAAVVDTLAAALGITFRADNRTPLEQLASWLRPRSTLLVIDNFEHLLPAASLLVEILQAAPHVVMLVTSREPLGVHAEDRIHVTGLATPPAEQIDEAGSFPAVRLFVDRAYRMDKRFRLCAENAPDVVQICRLVEGRPLAIELAAWHVGNRTCRAIVEAIRADLDFLAAESPDLPPRQRSLRAIFQQSWQALTPSEQSCFARLSLFRNPFSVDAAIAVAGASLPVLTRLYHAHLLERYDDFDHFTFHELLRQFATDKLTQSISNPTELQLRHAEYFLTWLSGQTQLLQGIQPIRCVEAIQSSLDDVRAAWAWASTSGHTDLLQRALPVLGAFYSLRAMHDEGEHLYRDTLAQIEEKEEGLRARLLAYLGACLEKRGKLDAARQALNSAIAIAQRIGDHYTFGYSHLILARLDGIAGGLSSAVSIIKRGLDGLPHGEFLTLRAELLIYLGTLESQLGTQNVAKYYEEVRRIVTRTGNKVQEQRLLLYQGVDLAVTDDVAARFYLERALALCPDTGDRVLETRILNALGFVHAREGNYEEAIRYHLSGLAICAADQEAIQQSHALHNLCVDYYGLGKYEEAYHYGREALAIAERDDLLDGIGYAQLHLGHVLAKMRLYGEAEQALKIARETFLRMEYKALEIETEAGLAHVDHLQGDLPAALAHVDRVLDFLASQSLAGTDEPTRIYLHCYQVLDACGDARAGQILTDAHHYIQKRAALLDADTRCRYLTAVPANRQFFEIFKDRGMALGDQGASKN